MSSENPCAANGIASRRLKRRYITSFLLVFHLARRGGFWYSYIKKEWNNIKIPNVNLEDLETIIGIVVAILGIIIAIKTYNRAKKNILQPMKTAVVNKQTDLFVELISFLKNDFSSLEVNSYIEIIQLSITSKLVELGFILGDHESVVKELLHNSKIKIYVGDGNQINSLVVVSPFSEKNEHNKEKINDQSKGNYLKFKEGIIELDFITVGKEYVKLEDELLKHLNNPLVPKVINDKIKKLDDLVKRNIRHQLKEIIIDFLKEYSSNDGKQINFTGVYNNFNRKRFNSKPLIESIELEVREYLRIDDEWR